MCQSVLGHRYNISPFVDFEYLWLLDVGQHILNSEWLLLLPWVFRVLCRKFIVSPVPLFVIYHIFCGILLCIKWYRTSVHGDNKHQLISIYGYFFFWYLENDTLLSVFGMWVGYWIVSQKKIISASSPKIHICFVDIVRMKYFWKSEVGGGGGGRDMGRVGSGVYWWGGGDGGERWWG